MRYEAPMIQCDGCPVDAPDYYEQLADSVNGVMITETRRAPGWLSDDEGDWCPDHAKTRERKP